VIRSETELFEELCGLLHGRDVARVELRVRTPSMVIRPASGAKQYVTIDMDDSAWQTWGRQATADWWALTLPAAKATVGEEEIAGQLLAWAPYRVWEQGGVEIYHHAGPSRIYWMSEGLREREMVSAALGGSYAVVSEAPLDPYDKAVIRHMITVTRPGDWKLPAATQDSTSMHSGLLLTDCLPTGALRPAVDAAAAWLRQVLPAHKVGAPSLDDVTNKLHLERRLRVAERVVGSARPLAFTMQAIPESTFPWPGLWLVSGLTGDFRTDLPVLLAWDSVLVAVAAATRLHVDVKPGLCYGPEFSQTVLLHERRFSKRDTGLTEAAYCQVNPDRITGPASIVASRLLQAATHELAHVVLRQLNAHSEVFAARREHLLLVASETLPQVTDLVAALGLHQRPLRTIPTAPVLLEDWLHENLLAQPASSVGQLVQAWASVRNLTEARAQRDVEEALTEAVKRGPFDWPGRGQYVVNRESSQRP
jgi:hypothetical protein